MVALSLRTMNGATLRPDIARNIAVVTEDEADQEPVAHLRLLPRSYDVPSGRSAAMIAFSSSGSDSAIAESRGGLTRRGNPNPCREIGIDIEAALLAKRVEAVFKVQVVSIALIPIVSF